MLLLPDFRDSASAVVGLRPVVFGLGTLMRGAPVLFLLGSAMTRTPPGTVKPVLFCEIFLFPLSGHGKQKSHIESHYPTQAKMRLEWGTPAFAPCICCRCDKNYGAVVP